MKLKKEIGFLGIFSIATGAMISSGIFILPGLVFAKTGAAVFVSYFFAGLLALLGILSAIELSTALPKAGGDYFFINKSLGPLIGTISGLFGWLALSLKSSFAIFGLSELLLILIGIPPLVSAGILCLLFVLLNIIGVKEAVFFQTVMVLALVAILAAFLIIGIPRIELSRFSTLFNSDLSKIVLSAGYVFVSFGGLLNISSISEEVKNPKKNLPLGMLASVALVTLLYGLITFSLVGLLESESLAGSLTPVADAARLIFGTPGFIIITIASSLAFITTANGGIMSASRYPLALSRDNLLPSAMNRVNKKFQTPTFAIVITGILIFTALLLPLDLLVKAASTVILTSYVLTNISVIILRESRLVSYKPSFKVPLYPWIQIISILIFSFFIIDLGMEAIEISLGFLFLSFCIYIFYGRRRFKGEYALLYLLKRIVDKGLAENLMENELREIIIHRDEIQQDQFDHLVKEAHFIDIKKALNYEEMIDLAANHIAEMVDMPKKEIVNRFIQRQKESNTALSSSLAIPHIVIDGRDKMFMIIARCKEGVFFTEKQNKVNIIFLLGGTKEKRVLHLRTIASIASIIQDTDFRNNWFRADNEEELKNLILLSDRKRLFEPINSQ